MRKKEEANEIRDKMESIRKEKQKPDAPSPVDNMDAIESTQKLLEPIIDAFIKEDRSLHLQSSDARNFYIGYGYLHVCRVCISSVHSDSVRVHLESDRLGLFHVYAGEVNDEAIETSVKNALLEWYRSLF